MATKASSNTDVGGMDLESYFDRLGETRSISQNPWERFGLRHNPFPSRAQPIWDVLHNQIPVVQRFRQELMEFVKGGQRNTRTMFFIGGNRVGKTHFMEHHRRKVIPRLPEHGIIVPVALAHAEYCDTTLLLGQMIQQTDESLREQTGVGLFQDPLPEAARASLDALPSGDFRNALRSCFEAKNEEARQEFSLLARRWLRGERLHVAKRKHLGVAYSLDSIGPLLNALEAMVAYLRHAYPGTDGPRCPGILLFLDELELVWQARRDRRDQFLRGLRATIDACANGGLFLCLAMTTGPTLGVNAVENDYPALFDRLVGARRDVPALTQIAGVLEAIAYAQAFLKYGRDQSGIEHASEELLSNQDIERIFVRIAGGGSVSQGNFFDALHVAAEEKAGDSRPR